MGTVVPELVRLAEDLTVIRDLGQFEPDRVYLRQSKILIEDLSGLSDEELTSQVVLALANLEMFIAEARHRGMMG